MRVDEISLQSFSASRSSWELLIIKQHAGLYRFTYHKSVFLVDVTNLYPSLPLTVIRDFVKGTVEVGGGGGSSLTSLGQILPMSWWCLVCMVQYLWGCRAAHKYHSQSGSRLAWLWHRAGWMDLYVQFSFEVDVGPLWCKLLWCRCRVRHTASNRFIYWML